MAYIGLYAEMLGVRQQEIVHSLDTLQQTAHTLLDTAGGAASEDEDDTGASSPPACQSPRWSEQRRPHRAIDVYDGRQ